MTIDTSALIELFALVLILLSMLALPHVER
jgi:hypothetical protein